VTSLAATVRNDVLARAWDAVRAVSDPEIPVLSVVDLGIVRSLDMDDASGAVRVGVSPTYSGCPATHVIRATLLDALHDAGFDHVEVCDVLYPPWTSDWITPEGRDKLHAYGIAPPASQVSSVREVLHGEQQIACPRCGSLATERISEFGSTPCKALHRCTACLEPFDYFKCI
jgi:ring-1,2-phenylacetyl-CoA epoxidase subunit PaaD